MELFSATWNSLHSSPGMSPIQAWGLGVLPLSGTGRRFNNGPSMNTNNHSAITRSSHLSDHKWCTEVVFACPQDSTLSTVLGIDIGLDLHYLDLHHLATINPCMSCNQTCGLMRNHEIMLTNKHHHMQNTHKSF